MAECITDFNKVGFSFHMVFTMAKKTWVEELKKTTLNNSNVYINLYWKGYKLYIATAFLTLKVVVGK